MINRVRERGNDEAPSELDRGFDLDHWLAATGGIPAELVDTPRQESSVPSGVQARPIMAMTVALLIVSAGFIAAANVSMPTGAAGDGDPAAAVPTTVDGGGDAGGNDSSEAAAGAPSTTTATATASPTVTASPTPTASPSPTATATPTPTESDPVDDVVETVDDTVDDTSDTVDDTVDDTGDTVDDTVDSTL